MHYPIQLEATELFFSARGYVNHLLKTQLSSAFAFHSPERTHDVIIACNLIAINENVDPETYEDLLLAACFNDIGYIRSIHEHKQASIDIATFILQRLNMSRGRISKIGHLIGITRSNGKASSLAEGIIRDADTFHLSKSNYQEYLLQLRKEWELVYNKVYTDKEWLLINLNFLNDHQYHTSYTKINWEEMKMNNLGFIEKVSTVLI